MKNLNQSRHQIKKTIHIFYSFSRIENMERIQILKKGDAPTSETSVWKDTNGFYRCLRCKFKSKHPIDVEKHYKSKHFSP